MPIVHRRLLLALAILVLPGCGMSLEPRVGAGGSDPARSPVPTPGRAFPLPGTFPLPGATPDPAGAGVLRRICRTSSVPRGWIAIRYVADADECPTSPDAENRYTAAVIQRYSGEPIGAVLTVCADQRIPSGWVRDRDPESTDGCLGARVRDGAPTTRVIRRVR